jgi:hypothetical protein
MSTGPTVPDDSPALVSVPLAWVLVLDRSAAAASVRVSFGAHVRAQTGLSIE